MCFSAFNLKQLTWALLYGCKRFPNLQKPFPVGDRGRLGSNEKPVFVNRHRYPVFLVWSVGCFLAFGAFCARAQTVGKQVQGYVLDTAGAQLKGVTVRLTSTQDTIVATSSEKGFYRFDGVSGVDIRLSYSMLGHRFVQKTVSLFQSSRFILMPNVVLMPQPSLIEGVDIVKILPVFYSGDTTQYNMDAFTFRPRALLEEALKQLPGIQVSRNGTLYAQGKVVSSVQVDGRHFFGGDVLTATRNLPASFVAKIQIIDTRGDADGEKTVGSGGTEKIINIVLKEDRKRISFGQVTAGGGTDDRFIGSLGTNRFDDGREFSLIASANNTNTSLFSFGSPSGAGNRERSLFDPVDFVDPTDGLNSIRSIGLHFSDNASPSTLLNVHYSFTDRKNFTDGNSLLRSTYVGNLIANEEDYETTGENDLHKVGAEFKHRFRNSDLLEIKPVFSYDQGRIVNSREKRIKNNRISNQGKYMDTVRNENPNLDASVFYSKAFRNPGRKLTGNILLNFHERKKFEEVNDQYQTIDSTYSVPEVSTFAQELFIQQNNGTNGFKASLFYAEQFFEHSLIELSYDYELTDMSTLRIVEDRLRSAAQGSPHDVDSLYVNYNYRFSSRKVGMNYRYSGPQKVFRANIGFAVQPITLTGQLPREDRAYKYANVNLVPTAGLKWQFSDEMDWSLDYAGRNKQPNAMHIIPILDNTNSQNIIVGNPELKSEFSNRLSTALRKSMSARGQYIEVNFAYNFVLNKIVSDKRAIGGSTVQETSFRNTHGYSDLRWYFLFSTPLFHETLQLDLAGNADLYNNISYVNDLRNRIQQFIYAQSAQLRYGWSDYLESMFNANYLLNHASYTWPFHNIISARSLLLSGATKGYLGDNATIGAELSQRFNSGYESSFMNDNPTIINAYLEFSFSKSRSVVLRLQGFDLLDQNKNMGTYSEYIGNDLYEARNNRLGRYFMATLSVRMQKYRK